jgi:hypothetical protein
VLRKRVAMVEAQFRAVRAERDRLAGEVERLWVDNQRLQIRVGELAAQVEELRRAGKRQAAPFSKNTPPPTPDGRAARRARPTPGTRDGWAPYRRFTRPPTKSAWRTCYAAARSCWPTPSAARPRPRTPSGGCSSRRWRSGMPVPPASSARRRSRPRRNGSVWQSTRSSPGGPPYPPNRRLLDHLGRERDHRHPGQAAARARAAGLRSCDPHFSAGPMSPAPARPAAGPLPPDHPRAGRRRRHQD